MSQNDVVTGTVQQQSNPEQPAPAAAQPAPQPAPMWHIDPGNCRPIFIAAIDLAVAGKGMLPNPEETVSPDELRLLAQTRDALTAANFGDIKGAAKLLHQAPPSAVDHVINFAVKPRGFLETAMLTGAIYGTFRLGQWGWGKVFGTQPATPAAAPAAPAPVLPQY